MGCLFNKFKFLFVFCLFTCFFVTLSSTVFSADRYNIGVNGNFSDTANWSTTSGGAGGSSVPGQNDVAIFDGGSGNCNMGSANVTIGAIEMKAGYASILKLTSGTLTIPGTSGTNGLTVAAGTLNHNSGTVVFANGSGGQHVYINNAVTLNNVKFDSGDNWTINLNAATVLAEGNVTFSGGIVTNGTLQVKGNASVDAAYSYELISSSLILEFTGSAVNQDFDISLDTADTVAGRVWVNKTSGTVTLIGALDVSGANASVRVTSGTFAQGNYDIGASASDGPKTLLLDGGTLTQGSGTINQKDNAGTGLTCSSGTFTGGSGNINLGGFFTISGCAFTSTTGTLLVNSHFTVSSGSFTHNSGTVSLGNGVIDQALNLDAGTISFNHLIINRPDNHTVTISGTTTATVVGNFTRTAGVLNSGTVTVQGNVTVTNTGTAMGTTAITLTGTNTQTVSVGNDFDGDLTINKTGGAANLGAALTLNATNQDLTIKEGTFDISGYALTVNGTSGTFIVEDGGNSQIQGGETITLNAGYPQLDAGSTVTYDGTAGPYTVADLGYHHLTFNGSGGVFNLGANESIAGNLTITAGTFDFSGYNMSVTGSFSNDDTLRLQGGETTVSLTMDTNSGTIEYDGTGSYTGLKAGNTYNHLKFSGSGTWTLNAALDVNNNITIGSTSTLTTGGYSINVGGTWSNSGTFNHGNGTVTLDGTDQSISGSTTFYNLTKSVSTARTLTIKESSTQTVAGTATLKGTSSNLLSLRSATTSTAWNFNPQGTRDIQYVDVKDSNNTNSTIVNCWTGCTNSNGNTSWSFAQPTVTLSVDSATIAEASGVATFTATLSAVSGATTTVELSASGTATGSGTDYTFSGTTITIAAGSLTGTRTVTATQDSLDEDSETVIIDISSVTNGTESGTQQQTTTITDDDSPPTVTLSSSTSISETGGSATVRATLSTASGKDVTVSYSFSGTATLTSDYTRSATQVTISAGNNTTGDITVSAASDSLDENDETVVVDIDTVTNGTESGTQQMTVTITDDDDAPTVTLSASTNTIAEDGSSSTLTATLSAVSGKSVTVNFSLSGTATVSTDYADPGSITISAGGTTGTTTVTSTADNIDESNETVIVDISTITNGTESGAQQVTVTITDDDTAGVTIGSPTQSGSVSEGSNTASAYTVVLTSQPTGDVSISISPNAQCQLAASTLTFTTANWNTTQTLSVTSVDDDIDDSNQTCTITHTATSADTNYSAIAINNQSITTVDNDSAGVTVTQSGGTTTITEGDTTDRYTIVLTSEPTSNVTISISVDSQCSVEASALTFTASNWESTQTVTVTATDDDIAEGSHTCAITHAAVSSDSGYNGLSVSAISAAVTDDDSAGVTITESGGSTSVATSGATDTYTLILTSQPTTTVTVTISAGTDLQTDTSNVSFTTDTWDIEQTVTVSSVEDDSYQGSEAGTITHASSSTDVMYASLSIASVNVAITDDVDDEDVVEVDAPDGTSVTSTREDGNTKSVGVDGIRILQSEDTVEGVGLVSTIQISSSQTFYSLNNNDLVVITLGQYVYIADPTANDNEGKVWVIDTQNAPATIYAWEEEQTGVTSLEGAAAGHAFGEKMQVCSIEDEPKIAIHSPGFGVIDIFTVDLTQAVMRVIENTDELSDEVFLNYNDLSADSECDLLTGPKRTEQTIDLSIALEEDVSHLTASNSTTSNKAFIIADLDELPTSIDLVVEASANIASEKYFYASAVGDVNGDGTNDAVITSLDACAAYIYYGDSNLSLNLDTDDADVTIVGTDCSNFFGYNVAVGDVNGDGIDDIVLVLLNGGGSQQGVIYIFLGATNLGSSLTTDDAIVITGTTISGRLGKTIVLADTDGDGVLNIIASEENGDETKSVILSLITDSSASSGGSAEHFSDWACSLNQQAQNNNVFSKNILIILCLFWGIIRYRVVGQILKFSIFAHKR